MAHQAAPVRARKVARRFIPLLLVVMWLVLAGIGGPMFGRVSEVSSNDPTAYLPSSAEATQVQERLGEFLGSDAIPAIVLFAKDTALEEGELDSITQITDELSSKITAVGEGSPPIPSEDGRAVQIFVPVDAQADIGEAVQEIDQQLGAADLSGIAHYVTGPAGFSGDLVAAFGGIDGLLLVAALSAVLIILLAVYRSPILPFAVLFTSVFALCGALLTVWLLAREGIVLLSGQTQGILFILVIGAATDYGLLYVARYREELRNFDNNWHATKAALRGSVEPIVASGGTVIAGLLCLLLSDLQSNRDLGPIAAIGIVFAMLAAFTLLPSILLLLGRTAFWPRRPRVLSAVEQEDADIHLPVKGIWHWLPAFIAKSPRKVWISTVLALLIACLGVLQLNASGVPQSDLVLGDSQARDGQKELAKHFPGGSGSPTYLLTHQENFDVVAETVLGHDGVASLAVVAENSPSGSATITEDGQLAPPYPGAETPEPTVSGQDLLFQVTLTDASDSAAATQTVQELRSTLGNAELGQQLDGPVLIGGSTATAIDSNDASIRDRNLIIPTILVVILLILMVLLRAIIAPLLLIATVVISFGTALGVSALVFNHVLGLPGADPAVPLFAFVFLVALGIDYNIFLMTRVKEESATYGTHRGITRGLSITGGVITSAGLVLAATFAALAVIPILFLLQLAFIVAFGVLVDTIVVRSLLVPALGYDIGRKIWWPGKLARGAK